MEVDGENLFAVWEGVLLQRFVQRVGVVDGDVLNGVEVSDDGVVEGAFRPHDVGAVRQRFHPRDVAAYGVESLDPGLAIRFREIGLELEQDCVPDHGPRPRSIRVPRGARRQFRDRESVRPDSPWS
jgi:hypothetical protein